MTISEKNETGLMHPGEYLHEVACALGIEPGQLAAQLGVPVSVLEQVLRGDRDISPEFALRLDRYFGSGIRMWLDLQSAYSLALIRRDKGTLIEEQVRPLKHNSGAGFAADGFEEAHTTSMYERTALPIGVDGGPPAGLYNGMPPVHPGEILNEDLEEMELTHETFAEKLGVSLTLMNSVLAGDANVDAELALRLSRYFGTSAEIWMDLQSLYWLKVAERELGERIIREVEPRVEESAKVVEAA